MKSHGWYIDFCENMRTIGNKSETIMSVMNDYWLAWFKVNRSKEYKEIVENRINGVL